MKNLLLTLLLIVMQQATIFSQIDKRSYSKSDHNKDYRSRFSRTTEFDRLRSFKMLKTFSMDDATILSLPDTIIEYSINDTTRSIHTYDEKGNFLSWTSQLYLKPDWENIERESYTYDDKGNFITWLYQEWENNNWVNNYRSFYLYDDYGNEIEYSGEEWTDNLWEVSYQSKTTNTYDESGNLLSAVEMKLIDGSSVNARRYAYSYDSNGNVLTMLSYKYSSDPWEYEEKYTFTYDSNNNIFTELSQFYSADAWSKGLLVTYSYNTIGSVEKKIYHNLDYNNEPYSFEFDTVKYEYDSNGNLLSIGESQIYSYDSNGNLSTWDFYTWNSETSQWIKKWSEPCLIFIKTDYTGKIWNYSVQRHGNGILFYTYGSGNKMIFSWTQVAITGLNDINENNIISIFPNPAYTSVTIKGIEKPGIVRIYSLDGKQIITSPITSSNQILNVSELKSGIYILRIETSGKIAVKKFIKQ